MSDPHTKRKRTPTGDGRRAGDEVDSVVVEKKSRASKKTFDVLVPDDDTIDLKAYRCGNIVRITMKNFMPYSDVTVHPGPRLNLVLAPNGIGKSTMVCAICIGLAGDPKSLGRAEQIKDFVKHGERDGYVELELYCGDHQLSSFGAPFAASQSIIHNSDNDDDDDGEGDEESKNERKRKPPSLSQAGAGGGEQHRSDPRIGRHGKNWIIRRNINIENKSKWFIDGKGVSEKQVKQLVRKLNIQVDNKCCFLSQDGVKSFAKMNPDRLLIELQDTIDPSLREQHKELCSLKKNASGSQTKLEDLKRQLLAKEETVNALKVDVDRMEQQQQSVVRLELLKKKRPWVLSAEAVSEYKKLTAVSEAVEKKVADEESKLGPTRKKLGEAKKGRDAATKKMESARNEFTALDKRRRDLGDAVDQSEEKSQKWYEEIHGIEDRKSAALANIERMKKEVERRRSEMKNSIISRDVIEARLKEIGKRTEKLRQERDDIETKIDQIRSDERGLRDHEKVLATELERARDSKQRKLQRVHPSEQNLYKFVQEELKRNHQQFSGRIHGPVFMEVEVKQPLHCKYIERCLPQWVQLSYVVEKKEDWNRLSEITKHIGRINVIHVTQSEEDIVKAGVRRPVDASAFSELGVEGYLDETIECNPFIMRALRDHSGIGISGYTNNEHPHIEDALENGRNGGFRQLYTPENVYNVAVSRYGGRVASTSVVSLSGVQPRLFAPADSTDTKQLEQELKDLTAKLARLQEERNRFDDDSRPIQSELSKLNEERKQLAQESRKSEHLQNEVRKAENMLRQAETDYNKEDDSEITRIRARIRKENTLRLKHVIELESMLSNWADRALIRDGSSLTLIQATAAVERAEREHHLAERDMKSLLAQRDQAVEDVAVAKDRAKKLQRQAIKEAPQDPWFDRFENSPQPIPESLQELDDLIADVQAAVDVNVRGQDATLKPRYEQAVKEREQLKAQIEQLAEDITNGSQRAQQLLEKWTTKLKSAVLKVNAGFAGYFRDMGCEGEIKLGEHGDDYEKYSLEIWVSYRPREQPLALLTAESQSGGERSVATMLFLLSLQHVTGTPFRVVDEINQGMDARNERMVFDQMVRSTLRGETPQYFLVTPKLLPGLDYSSAITVLFILSGPYMVSQSTWENAAKTKASNSASSTSSTRRRAFAAE